MKKISDEEYYNISIHALRVESDYKKFCMTSYIINFNPRSPCGERRLFFPIIVMFKIFQSTLSVWRATDQLHATCDLMNISIHALRVESDRIKKIGRDS